jgi:hypothetical protein
MHKNVTQCNKNTKQMVYEQAWSIKNYRYVWDVLAATDAAKDAAPAQVPAPPVVPAAALPSWPSLQHPSNGAIQMWPYGQGGMICRQQPAFAPPPSYVPRHTHRCRMHSAPRAHAVSPAPPSPTTTATHPRNPTMDSVPQLHRHRR